MKIIKPSIDLSAWFLAQTCPTCKSQIGIEAKDIRYAWNRAGEYYYTCELCDTKHYLVTTDLPPIVTAEVRKYRSDPITYID